MKKILTTNVKIKNFKSSVVLRQFTNYFCTYLCLLSVVSSMNTNLGENATTVCQVEINFSNENENQAFLFLNS